MIVDKSLSDDKIKHLVKMIVEEYGGGGPWPYSR